jgi:hypothetical protein
MHVVTLKKKESMTVTIPAPRPRCAFARRLRNAGGIHQDRRRRKEKAAMKERLRRGEDG